MTFSRRQIFAASGALTATAFAMGEALASANADDAARDRIRKLVKELDIKVPIFQAPFGGATTPALAATVSNAGGLGGLSVTFLSAENATNAIKSTRSMTSSPLCCKCRLDAF